MYPEELDIKTAYWWAPDSSAIAYLEMDERKVAQYPLLDFASFDGKAIVLLAHYDSVPAGPGASDDEFGVATVLP